MDMFQGSAAPWFHDDPEHRCLFAGPNPALSVIFNTFGDANALCRRAAFLEVEGFTEDYGVGYEDWELFTRFMLRGHRLTVIPEALFWYRFSPTSMIHSTPVRANFARSLRPHLELIPQVYHPLIEMILGQTLKNRGIPKVREVVPPPPLPLRYRVVDALNARLKRMAKVHRILKRSARLAFHAGQVMVEAARHTRPAEESRTKRRQTDFGPNLIRHEGSSTPRPMALKRITFVKGERR